MTLKEFFQKLKRNYVILSGDELIWKSDSIFIFKCAEYYTVVIKINDDKVYSRVFVCDEKPVDFSYLKDRFESYKIVNANSEQQKMLKNLYFCIRLL